MIQMLVKTLLVFGLCQPSVAEVSPNSAHVAWVGGDYGPCVKTCKGQVNLRKVECKDVFTGAAAAGCKGDKPVEYKACSCDLVQCAGQDSHCPSDPADGETSAEEDDDYEEMGCFERAADDEKGTADCTSTDLAMDKTCMTYAGSGPCRSGFPFYRMHSDMMSPAVCFSFCVGKGLDLFALVDGAECRCGASAMNVDVWERKTPRSALAFSAAALKPMPMDGKCEVRVWRYSGHYESGSVPDGLTDIMASDSLYVDSIVAGKQITEEQEEDGGHAEADKDKDLALKEETAGPKWDRPCWPSNCGPGSGPWRARVQSPPGGGKDLWKEYVRLPYMFESNVDDARKRAFESAVKAWRDNTCVYLVEDAKATASFIKVGIYSASSCYLSGMGYQNGHSKINLGWCNSMHHRGNMIHEIGHAIGMNHEQKRQDAGVAYEGKGPHLKILWQNINDRWKPQYLPDPNTYIGSKNDGKGDPHPSGYSPYDFESIMHYPGGSSFDTIPASNERLVGNRKHLTAGDILQINDVYQCIPAGASKVTTTTTTTTPDPTMLFCDFEGTQDLCGGAFSQDKADVFDWTYSTGGTPSGGTGPAAAASGKAYLFIETSSPRKKGEVAKLVSAPVALGKGASISMNYHMLGGGIGRLIVNVIEAGTSQGAVLLDKQGTQGNAWHPWTKDLAAYEGKTVSFSISGIVGGSWQGDIAIDAIALRGVSGPNTGNPKPPSATPPPPTSLPTAAPTSPPTAAPTSPPTAAPTSRPTAAPTHPPTAAPTSRPKKPPTTSPTSKTCSFENGLCGMFKQDKNDVFDWTTANGGKTPSGGTGPSKAKTGKKFLFIETSWPRKAGDVATLVSNPVTLSQGGSMSMQYNMNGGSIGELQVVMNYGGKKTTLLKKTGKKGKQWILFHHDLGKYAGETVSFEISGKRGSSWQGDIAIDDVSINAGSAVGNPSPTKGPSTSPPTAAPTSPPTAAPTSPPTGAPTAAPTAAPTSAPTVAPTAAPTSWPTAAPTSPPTVAPTAAPTSAPTGAPTAAPTAAPITPTVAPTSPPTAPTDPVQAIKDLNGKLASGLKSNEAKMQALDQKFDNRVNDMDKLLQSILNKLNGGLTLSEEDEEVEVDEPGADSEEPANTELEAADVSFDY